MVNEGSVKQVIFPSFFSFLGEKARQSKEGDL